MKKYLLSILCTILLLSGCNYLDMVPEKDIETIESIFEQKTKVEQWWKALYSDLNILFASFKTNNAYTGADEFVTCQALYNAASHLALDGLESSQWSTNVTRPLRYNMEPNVHCYPQV